MQTPIFGRFFNRRQILSLGVATVAIGVGARLFGSSNEANAKGFEVSYSEDEWRKRLTSKQFEVLRKHGTERPYTSPLNDEKRIGVFHCAGCDLPLFDSSTKYDSRTGWPSFWDHLPNAIGRKEDNSFFMKRIEVHCRRCGGHQGHVFNDGPPPTGLRYCINGVAMTFKPAIS